jgi:hypothetical protein
MENTEMWMTEPEKEFFLGKLNKDDIYLEWGSGGSTSIVPPPSKESIQYRAR